MDKESLMKAAKLLHDFCKEQANCEVCELGKIIGCYDVELLEPSEWNIVQEIE